MNDKSKLRATLRARRTAFVQQLGADAVSALQAQLAAIVLPHLHDAGCVAVYAAHGAEIDPIAIAQQLLYLGRTVLWPRVDHGTNSLTFHACAPQALVPGFRKLPEPPAGSPAVTPDIILLPLIGADLAGNRIGQGGGHYDRTLAALRDSGLQPLTIGLAWEVQIVDGISTDTWDQRLDALATPQRWNEFPRR